MNKVFQVMSCLTLLISIALIIFVAFNLLYPYPTIVIHNQPVTLVNKVVHQGEVLQVVTDYTKYTDKPATVTREFINDMVFTMPPYRGVLVKGSRTVIMLSVKVPFDLPPGEYYLHSILEYDFPPFRTVTYVYDSEKFMVVK